jgi:hypothetical protein
MSGSGTVTCPAAQTAPLRAIKDGHIAHFGHACRSCPLAERGTASTSGRSIHVGLYEQQLARARSRQTDPAWKADYTATRPKVERKISHLMRRPLPRGAHGAPNPQNTDPHQFPRASRVAVSSALPAEAGAGTVCSGSVIRTCAVGAYATFDARRLTREPRFRRGRRPGRRARCRRRRRERQATGVRGFVGGCRNKIWPCQRRTKGLLATVRDRPVAARDQPYAECRPQLPHIFVVAKHSSERTRSESESRSPGDRRTRCQRGCSFVDPVARPSWPRLLYPPHRQQQAWQHLMREFGEIQVRDHLPLETCSANRGVLDQCRARSRWHLRCCTASWLAVQGGTGGVGASPPGLLAEAIDQQLRADQADAHRE